MEETAVNAKYWQRIHHRDYRALMMADRHYSRQHPGSPEFTRPGNKIILMHFTPEGDPSALWASQRPDPSSGIKRADNRHAWDCSLFRIEIPTVYASELIQEAVAITKDIWDDELPSDGFVTTIDRRKVAPMKRRGQDVWGYCYEKAGWVNIGLTKTRKLVLLQLTLLTLAGVKALRAPVNCGGLFGTESLR